MSLSWVCPECGLDYQTVSPSDAKVAIRSFPRRYREALAGTLEDDADEGLIRRRPEPGTWSALEYTAHVADLYEVFADIIRRMRTEERPNLTMFDPDQRAIEALYNEQDPREVLDRFADAAERLAAEADKVDADSWERTAVFPWGERTLLDNLRNAVHEGTHHLRDVNHVLEAARRAGPA
jgi:hypothetical protein